ncbi:glutamic-type intramembrane protease PrsW [Numidum massiliense]|uniref:glutamic-type intramembrane protease PrsW n=1 Tax=Numidum massiliense TaxID=1522315 RepID=UPI0006D542E5|nr:glutamic-type intramembrane protease PrsW [Numidum massiliense]
MNVLSYIVAGFAPGIALLCYFYLRDQYRPEPIKYVLKMFIAGLFLVFPTMALQHAFRQGFGEPMLFDSFVTIAFLEEALKCFFLYQMAYKFPGFEEPYDGIVYGVAIALGFATAENMFYIFINGIHVAWLRALVPVSGHALFGVLMGFYLAKARFAETRKRWVKWTAWAVCIPVAAHGCLDFILLYTDVFWKWIIGPFMIVLWFIALRRAKIALERSPFAKAGEVGYYST